MRVWILAGAALALVVTACGDDDGSDTDGGAATDVDATDSSPDDSSASSADSGDDGSSGGDASSDDGSSGEEASSDDDGSSGEEASSDDDGSSGGDASSVGGGGAGTLVVGDETISLDSSRCFLESQDAVGGGKILFVAQAFGTNAAGEPLVLDVSRYDEDSQFTGDDIKVDIGDPYSDDAVSLSAIEEVGTVAIDGSTLSADGLTFSNFTDLSEQSGSFEFSC
jgi:hypothetical protein